MSIPPYADLAASNGSGEPVRAVVQANRIAGSATITVNATTNWPTGTFIATTGTLQSNGTLLSSTVQVFYGTASGTTITITSFAAGYTDLGNSIADVVVVKPSTEWANVVSNSMGYVVGLAQEAAGGWQSLGATPTYSANNGNKEFVLATSSNLTGTLSPGMKLQYQPTSQTATQSALFASASSQYATKASPTGITFTTAFTCMGWINPASYTAGGILSRFSTTGFSLALNASGQVVLTADGTTTSQTSYQSVPLNQWIHVAATYSAGTMVLYINGALVQSVLAGSSTSITQAGNLQIGAIAGGTFFNGNIAQVGLYSSALSQATIQSYMTKTLTGSESTCVGFWPLNGGWSDLSSNANTLTPTNSPIATSTVCPFNATGYGTITAITSSTISIYTGILNNVPNQTLQNFYYSSAQNPYGFPLNLLGGANTVIQANGNPVWQYLGYAQITGNFTTASSTAVQITGLTVTVTVPTGFTKVKITAHSPAVNNTTSVHSTFVSIWRGTVGSGTQLQNDNQSVASNSGFYPITTLAIDTPSAGSVTYNIGLATDGSGTAQYSAASTALAFILVECC